MSFSLDKLKKLSKEARSDASGKKTSPKGIKGEKIKTNAPEMTFQEEVIDTVKFVAIAVAITLVFRMFIFQPFNIPSGSMKSNLLVGDFIWVSKTSYGYSKSSLVYPFTRIDSNVHFFGKNPQLGEVAVFKNKHDKNKDYIKRVVGLPGDKVQVIGGILHINGEAVTRKELSSDLITCESYSPTSKIYQETMPNGISYVVQECAGDTNRLDNTELFTVPADHYFMMGDNRDNSADSRTSVVKFVPREAFVGEAKVVFFSVDGNKSKLWQIWKWPSAIRYSRIFDSIE